MEWDHLTEEAWLCGDVSTQLADAQQQEVHGMFQDLSERVQQDKEAAARV